jgi:spermidine synthase
MNRTCTTPMHAWIAALLLSGLLGLAQAAAAAERIIFETKSPYNTIVVSEDRDGLRILRFERFGARQSVVKVGDPDHLELTYARVMAPIPFLFVEEPRSALIIGLGGGTIPSFLRKHFPQMKIDVVDIDPGVVAVAKSHFGFREDPLMRAHVEDGRRFVENAKQRYDLVYLDGFGTDSVPRHLTTREFLTAVREILTPQGMAVGNLWGRAVNRNYDSMVKTYQSVFEGLLLADVIGSANKIVLATAKKLDISDFDLTVRTRTVSRQLELRQELNETNGFNLRTPESDGASGKLLTDAEVGFRSHPPSP